MSKNKGGTHPITASHEIKTIRTRIKQIGVEISDLNKEKGRVQKEITDRNRRINKLNGRLKELQGKEIEITDHALLRYLERVEGLDVDELKSKIITDKLCEQVKTVGGSGRFPGPSGTRLVMQNKRIISVVPS